MIYGLAMDASICLDIQTIVPSPALLFSGMLFDRSYRRFVKGGKAALENLDPDIVKVSLMYSAHYRIWYRMMLVKSSQIQLDK